MRRKRTSSGTCSRRRSLTRGRSGSGTSPTSESSQARNPRRYVYRLHGVVRPERSVSEDAETTCPVCGSANSREATSCGSCGYSLSDASRTDKVDALLDDLMDLSKAPPEITEPEPPVEESPDVDETVAEKLFDSLLVEIQPAGQDEVPEVRADSSVAEVPEPRSELFADVSRVPVSATPAETEAGKLLRVSGRMFDLVTFGSGAALVATFLGFRMYQSLFDAWNPLLADCCESNAFGGIIAVSLR